MLATRSVHSSDDSDCGGDDDGGSATDSSGDTISVTGDSGTLVGTPLDDNGFDTSNFDADFGTSIWDGDGGFVVGFQQVVGYPPMSQACSNDLQSLNAAFYSFMVAAFSSVIGGSVAGIAAKAVKVGISTGTGVAAANSGVLGSLIASQNAVNADCSGQGAGQNPNGPLPNGYTPGN
jgi:hypothetical protein